jgi:hypothetical protein
VSHAFYTLYNESESGVKKERENIANAEHKKNARICSFGCEKGE